MTSPAIVVKQLSLRAFHAMQVAKGLSVADAVRVELDRAEHSEPDVIRHANFMITGGLFPVIRGQLEVWLQGRSE